MNAIIDTKSAVLCPRCGINYYTPTEKFTDPGTQPAPPALSRTTRDDKNGHDVPEKDRAYVCSSCGTHEALEQFQGHLTPQSEWPMLDIGVE